MGLCLIAELGASRGWGLEGFGVRSQLMHPAASRSVGVPPQPPGGSGLPPCTPQPPKTLQRFGALGRVHFGGAPWHKDVGVVPPPQGIGDGKPLAHIMLSPQKPSSRAGGAGPGGLVRQWGTRARQQARGRREELAEVRVLESF